MLLEVVAALTIFAFAAAGALALLSQLADTEKRSQASERMLADEQRLLTAYSLLLREDLDQRLGQRTVGLYLVEVQRPEQALYRIAIGDSTGPDLVTLLYRPGPTRAP